MRPVLAACLLILGTSAASAQWLYDSGSGPAGQAVATSPSGVGIAVECGNGGLPGFVVTGHNPGAGEEIFVLRVDQNPEMLLFSSCQGATCQLDMDTMEQATRFFGELRSGSSLMIGLYRRGALADISLSGSSAAIDRVTAAGCGF